MKISIIIPVYNFSTRLAESVTTVQDFFAQNTFVSSKDVEIIWVDDGSTDGTRVHLERLAAPSRSLYLKSNQGKGAAIKAGVATARGEYIFFTDADIPYDLTVLHRALKEFEEGNDMVCGSRYLPGSSNVASRTILRRLSSSVFSLIANIVLLERVVDTQCGFKGFRHDTAKKLFQRVSSQGFIFDVELLYEAQRDRARISHIPVTLIDDSDSSVRLFRDSLRMTWDVCMLYIRTRRQGITRFVRYGVTGLFNTGLNLSVFNLLMISTGIYEGPWVTIFSLLSFTIVITIAFFINASWVFKKKDRLTADGYGKFFLVSGAVALINVLFIHVMVNVIGPQFGFNSHIWANIAAVMTAIISVIGNYTGYRLFVFK